MSRWRIVLVVFVTVCMLLSDCMSLLGAWVYNLKYVGLVCLMLFSVICSGHRMVRKGRLALVLIGVLILVTESLFQEGRGVSAKALALYAGLGLVICFSAFLVESRRSLLVVGIASALVVVLLLALSWRDCLAQWRFYVGIGRPRLKGCFSNPNSLGAISSIVLVELICGQAETRLEGRLEAFSALAMVATLALSGSRTSMLMMAGFCAMLAYQRGRARSADYRVRALLLAAVVSTTAIGVLGLARSLAGDVTVMARLGSLLRIDFGSGHFLFGLGYVSADNISLLTEEAGGAVEMLLVSLYYRVGVLGILAYVLLLAATAYGTGRGCEQLFAALLFSALLQSLGESYLSSIMSYPSCFIWLLLSTLPMLASSSGEGAVVMDARDTERADLA